MTTPFTVQRINASAMMDWLTQVHYLHRPVVNSKLLGYGVFIGRVLVGGVLWATPHFTKKRDLFGFPDTLDKWEVLMLARFYLVPDSGLRASSVLSDIIGASGRNAKSKRRRGWRVQEDWVSLHPPPFPDNPFVPRLLISWSDDALETTECCEVCGQRHEGQHKGTIYRASGWEQWDISASSGRRTGRSYREEYTREQGDGRKICWVMRLAPNTRAERLGTSVQQIGLFDGAYC